MMKSFDSCQAAQTVQTDMVPCFFADALSLIFTEHGSNTINKSTIIHYYKSHRSKALKSTCIGRGFF